MRDESKGETYYPESDSESDIGDTIDEDMPYENQMIPVLEGQESDSDSSEDRFSEDESSEISDDSEEEDGDGVGPQEARVEEDDQELQMNKEKFLCVLQDLILDAFNKSSDGADTGQQIPSLEELGEAYDKRSRLAPTGLLIRTKTAILEICGHLPMMEGSHELTTIAQPTRKFRVTISKVTVMDNTE